MQCEGIKDECKGTEAADIFEIGNLDVFRMGKTNLRGSGTFHKTGVRDLRSGLLDDTDGSTKEGVRILMKGDWLENKRL